jgi:hypothetical protein
MKGLRIILITRISFPSRILYFCHLLARTIVPIKDLPRFSALESLLAVAFTKTCDSTSKWAHPESAHPFITSIQSLLRLSFDRLFLFHSAGTHPMPSGQRRGPLSQDGLLAFSLFHPLTAKRKSWNGVSCNDDDSTPGSIKN